MVTERRKINLEKRKLSRRKNSDSPLKKFVLKRILNHNHIFCPIKRHCQIWPGRGNTHSLTNAERNVKIENHHLFFLLFVGRSFIYSVFKRNLFFSAFLGSAGRPGPVLPRYVEESLTLFLIFSFSRY